MFEYQKNQRYFAQVAGSLEKHAKDELTELGAEVLQEIPRGLRFTCDQKTLYQILYSSRLVQRILAPLISFQCHSEKYLYNQAFQNIQWTDLFRVTDTFSIISNVSRSKIQHSLYAGQILKDAICDQFREKFNARPDFKTKDADFNLNLHISDNWASIYLDIGGQSLHKRGYRKSAGFAPLQETLAAVIVKLTEWDGSQIFHDICCGSGTLLAEALMKYCQIPAGFLREHQAITFMPDFNKTIWDAVINEANDKIKPLPKNLIKGSDIDPEAIEKTRENLASLPYGKNVELLVSSFQNCEKEENKCVVCNPPYGIRLGDKKSTIQLYQDLGDFLKQKCPSSTAYILCGSADLVPALRLRAHWKKSLKNADIETKLVKIIIK